MDENKLENLPKDQQEEGAVAEEHFEQEELGGKEQTLSLEEEAKESKEALSLEEEAKESKQDFSIHAEGEKQDMPIGEEEKEKEAEVTKTEPKKEAEGFYYYNRQELEERQKKVDKESGFSDARKREEEFWSRKRREKKNGQKIGIYIGIAILVGIIGGGTMYGANTLMRLMDRESSRQEEIKEPSAAKNKEEIAPTEKIKEDTQAKANPIGGVEEVAKTAMPAVVAITNKSVQEVQNWFGGQIEEYENEYSGSGIIVGENDTELLIATNYHVIEGATTLTVAFADGEAVEGQVKGGDSEHDLAVLAVKLKDIEESTKKEIRIIEIGDSDALNVGQQVVAIGNALGYGQSVTTGIVSALNRKVEVDDTSNTLIQTDAAINPGNSGGALLNMQGQLIGINAVKYAAKEVEGMGYAIPVAIAQPILDDLMNRQTRYRVDEENASYLGIECKNVSQETSEAYGIPMGIYVAGVTEDGPAKKAGIKKGDIIIKLDGISLSDYQGLVDALKYYAAGEKVEIVVARANNGTYEEKKIEVTLGKREDMPQNDRSRKGESEKSQRSPGGGFFQNPDINDLLP